MSVLSRCDGIGAIHTDIGASYLETRTLIARLQPAAVGIPSCPVFIRFARLVHSGSGSSMKWYMYGVLTLLGLISGARCTSGPIGRPFLPPQPIEVM